MKEAIIIFIILLILLMIISVFGGSIRYTPSQLTGSAMPSQVVTGYGGPSMGGSMPMPLHGGHEGFYASGNEEKDKEAFYAHADEEKDKEAFYARADEEKDNEAFYARTDEESFYGGRRAEEDESFLDGGVSGSSGSMMLPSGSMMPPPAGSMMLPSGSMASPSSLPKNAQAPIGDAANMLPLPTPAGVHAGVPGMPGAEHMSVEPFGSSEFAPF